MNEVKYISLEQKDGYVTKLTYYVCPKTPKASILILHGMAEHHKRYRLFIEFLLNQDYDVYSYDHRGHGTDKKINELGFFAHENGFELVVSDAISICNYIKDNNRSHKFILFGHSMGSLISRNVIQHFDSFNGVILCGTTYPSKFILLPGVFISAIIKKIKGPKHKSPFMNNLLFGGKKYTSLTTRTTFDWLTRSNPIVGAYIHDPYCGFICTTSFYHDLIKLTINATKKNLIKQTKRDLPLYIISGDKDPVGGYGKEINKFVSVLKQYEFTNVSSKLYPECRHEILNELNYKEVFSDIQTWIAKRL